jgi:AhpD family alkylhydroperoxidase
MAMGRNYPEYLDRLKVMTGKLSKELPGPLSGYIKLHKGVMTQGALSRKAKELIALALSITARCEGCIAFHVHDALGAGAARQEILEKIGVAILMGGGPSMVYGLEALDALDQFEAKGTDA